MHTHTHTHTHTFVSIHTGEKDVQLSVLKIYLNMFLVQYKYNVMHF